MALWTERTCVPFPAVADLAETLWPYGSLVSARPLGPARPSIPVSPELLRNLTGSWAWSGRETPHLFSQLSYSAQSLEASQVWLFAHVKICQGQSLHRELKSGPPQKPTLNSHL